LPTAGVPSRALPLVLLLAHSVTYISTFLQSLVARLGTQQNLFANLLRTHSYASTKLVPD